MINSVKIDWMQIVKLKIKINSIKIDWIQMDTLTMYSFFEFNEIIHRSKLI